MLKMKKGCKIPFPEKLKDAYEVKESQIFANVGINKIEEVLQHFIVMHEEPLFFILELPASKDDETEVKPGVVETFHKNVYYIDGCSGEEALTILIRVGDVLINDGLSAFGFGGHESGDEIMFTKYNVLTIYSTDLNKYDDFFESHGILRVANVVTAWDTFSEKHPGVAERYESGGKTVFDIPKQFEEWGMYKYCRS